MKRIAKYLGLFLLLLLLFSCKSIAPVENGSDSIETVKENSDSTPAIDYTDGRPWMDSNIEGNVTPETPTDLKDDFYLYVNKDRILDVVYQPGKIRQTALDRSSIQVEENKKRLLTDDSIEGFEAEQLRAFYNALDDWETRTPMAIALATNRLEKIDSLSSIKDFYDAVHVWGDTDSLSEYGLINVNVTTSLADPTTYTAEIEGRNLLLGDAGEYKKRTDLGDRTYKMYKGIYELGLELIGAVMEEDAFDRAIAFEAGIAEHTLTQEDLNRSDIFGKVNNILTLDEVDELLGPNYNFRKEMEDNGYISDTLWVVMPDQIAYLGEILSDEKNLDEIKNWMKVRVLINAAPDVSKEAMLTVEKINTETSGITESTPYESILVTFVGNYLNVPMQIAYVEEFASPEMKSDIKALCEDIAAEYKIMLSQEDWLEEETKKAAIAKLDNLKINSVYPDKWPDYSGLDIRGLNYYEARKAIRNYGLKLNREKLGKKIDPEIWSVNVLEANASYNSMENSINIYLGILGDETYTTDMSKERVYGKIGAIIGHEISHAFDSKGSQFDENGNIRIWWTENDAKAFQEKVKKVQDFYSNISIYDDMYLNGAMLDGEVTADITGIQCILRLAEKDDDFDYDEFFRAYAEIWMSKRSLSSVETNYYTDPHPPEYLRTNVTLQQFDKFLDTYGITEGDNMFLAPEDRILVW